MDIRCSYCGQQWNHKQQGEKMQDSLRYRIDKGKGLTEEEIDSLVKVLCHGCHQKTKVKIRRVLSWVPDIKNYVIYERILMDPIPHYCAGQDYTVEIPRLRKLLLDF